MRTCFHGTSPRHALWSELSRKSKIWHILFHYFLCWQDFLEFVEWYGKWAIYFNVLVLTSLRCCILLHAMWSFEGCGCVHSKPPVYIIFGCSVILFRRAEANLIYDEWCMVHCLGQQHEIHINYLNCDCSLWAESNMHVWISQWLLLRLSIKPPFLAAT
jgi:hypothetical protein